jgi:RNA methyltransferase, TrmH family
LPSGAAYRVAEGAFESVTLYRASLAAALPGLQPAFRIIGAAPAGGVMPAGLRRLRPAALVLGNEESGLAPATLALCDMVATIPGSGHVESLNVAAAAAVLLYALTAG